MKKRKVIPVLISVMLLFFAYGTIVISLGEDRIDHRESELFTVRSGKAVGKDVTFQVKYIDQGEYPSEVDISNTPQMGILSIWGPSCTGTCHEVSCDGTCFWHQGNTCDHGQGSSTCDGTCAADTCYGYQTCDNTCPGDGHTCWCGHETCDNQGECTGS